MQSISMAQPSAAFVDASQFYTTDICTAIATILSVSDWNYNNSNGVVIDARGIGQGTTVTCSVNPWENWSAGAYNTTVLLPAATILIQNTWVVPPLTRLVGAGSGLTSTSNAGITVLKACTASICSSAFNSSGTDPDMIDMGAALGTYSWCGSNFDCQAVVLEHFQLNGNGLSGVNGIYNQLSQELSYANDVKLTNFTGTGVMLMGGVSGMTPVGPANSGPYTKIYYSGSGTCANLNDIDDTRGIHGLTCVTSASPVIYLDATNDSIEDITIEATATSSGSQDGILIGSAAAAQSNVLFNISGTGTGLGKLIHISNHVTGTLPNAADLTIMGVTNLSSGATTIQDDLTGATLSDPNLGIYALGEQLGSIAGYTSTSGYSRFTTSVQVPTWLVGPVAPSGACNPGTLYSCTGSSCGKTLYACTNSSPGPGSVWFGLE
jgi:hypothetical protein